MKKIILTSLWVLSSIGFAAAPKVKGEISVGGGYIGSNGYYGGTITPSANLGLQYNTRIDDKWDIDYGPGVNAAMDIYLGRLTTMIEPNIMGTFRVDSNYRFEGNKKVYFGAEAGLGVGILVHNNGVNPQFRGLFKVHSGLKVNNFNVGAFVGTGKGIAGIEVGQTF